MGRPLAATAPQLRLSLEMARMMAGHNIRFVPMPCANQAEFDQRIKEMTERLERLELECKKEAPHG